MLVAPFEKPEGESKTVASQSGRISRALQSVPTPVFAAYAIVAAFSTYFCMYAFRKPFAAAEFADLTFAGLPLKTVFVISQLVGYTLSKYLGTKFCSEVRRGASASGPWT